MLGDRSLQYPYASSTSGTTWKLDIWRLFDLFCPHTPSVTEINLSRLDGSAQFRVRVNSVPPCMRMPSRNVPHLQPFRRSPKAPAKLLSPSHRSLRHLCRLASCSQTGLFPASASETTHSTPLALYERLLREKVEGPGRDCISKRLSCF